MRPRSPGALNTGFSSSHCSSVRSLGYDMPRTVTTRLTTAIGTHPVRAGWRQSAGGELADPGAPGLPAGRLRVGDDLFARNLRRIGRELAWCLNLTALLISGADDTIGPLLHELTDVMRQRGLIPVATERFA